MAANPKTPPIAEIRKQAHALIDQVPNEVDWLTLLHDVQRAADRATGVLAQELDPGSPLRQALTRGLAELDAGDGVDDETIARDLGARG